MTPEDEEFLTELILVFGPQALPAGGGFPLWLLLE
jgi:hypothetical protein